MINQKLHTKLTLILTLFNFFLFGQSENQTTSDLSRKVDSLLIKLKASKEDTNKVFLLNEISWELITSEPQEAIKYVQQSIYLSNKLHFQNGLADSYIKLGGIYYYEGNYI